MKTLKLTIILIALLSIFFGFSGCSKKDASQRKKGSITIKGSDTMVQLISVMAEAYMKSNPGSQVSVTGGGTGTGIAALINGTTDICTASREMQEKEKKEAEGKNIKPIEYTIANDGLAVFVNPENPINEMTMEQVKKIYTGVYKSWKDLKGKDEPIIGYSRENSSGTYVFFQEHILNKEDFAKTIRLMPATSTIIQSVSEDKLSIGYGGLGYTKEGNVKVLNIKKDENSASVIPSKTTVLDRSYPLSRPLYLIFNGEPKDDLKNFLDFCLSDNGQKIVEETGYITVK